MNRKKILFISGSLGLGHIGRDIEIVKELRLKEPDVDVSWLAEDPASMVLSQAGEKVLPEAKLLASGNDQLESSAQRYNANLVKFIMNMRKGWSNNARVAAKAAEEGHFDLMVGDETYELLIEMARDQNFKKVPFIVIYDFVGVDSTSHNPVDSVAAYMINRLWTKALKAGSTIANRSLFIGEIEDVPDRGFGFVLPNRRDLASKAVDFVGYVFPFDPDKYRDKTMLRKLLGYGEEPLVICSIGGTSAGRGLFDLCAKAYPLVKKTLPDSHMIFVCGPRVSPDTIQAPEGVEVRGYVPELFKHLAASDLCIVTGGGTITLELTALQKPFLYFPLEQHFEQEVDVVRRCERHKAGIRMVYSKTTPEILAQQLVGNIWRKVNYSSIPVDGAIKAAQLISQTLRENQE
jgi:UDP:flavonoid glycosyltransferase YjiC (YdhE family)